MKPGDLVTTLRSGNPRVAHFAALYDKQYISELGYSPVGYMNSDELGTVLDVQEGGLYHRHGPVAKILTTKGVTGWTMVDNLEIVP